MPYCNLMLHCGAHAVPRKELAHVRTPQATDTWQPIPHDTYVRHIESELPNYNLSIVQQAHALTHDGSRCGEVHVSRKHTTNILRDLPMLVGGALERLLALFRTQDQRVDQYKTARLSDVDAHDLTVRALDADVICASRIPDVLREWREPRYDAFKPRTAWSWFNAVTETLKGSLHVLPRRTQALYRICDAYVGHAA